MDLCNKIPCNCDCRCCCHRPGLYRHHNDPHHCCCWRCCSYCYHDYLCYLCAALLYVKESSDKAYHAIHLELPTVGELLKAVSSLSPAADHLRFSLRLRSSRWPSGEGVRLQSGRSGVRTPLATGFSVSSQTSDLKTGTPVATLPDAWRYRVSAGTGRVSVYCDRVR